jgi:hypothetical protein
MVARDYIKAQLDTLPESIIEKVLEFIFFQKFSNDLIESDEDYFASVPGMKEIIMEGLTTPLSECISLSDVRKNVRG